MKTKRKFDPYRTKCKYCDNRARRTAGGIPICGNYKHYHKAVREHYKLPDPV